MPSESREPLTESERLAEELLPHWTPERCPRCGGPLVVQARRGVGWMCRACTLYITPTGTDNA